MSSALIYRTIPAFIAYSRRKEKGDKLNMRARKNLPVITTPCRTKEAKMLSQRAKRTKLDI